MPRLMCDGNGNLLIDDPESEDHGQPVKYHEGSFVKIGPHDTSHNDTHHENFAKIDGTRDVEKVAQAAEDVGQDPANYGFLVNAGDGENMHHFEVQPDDPHFNGIKQHPDTVAPKVTGHTEAWKDV